MAKCPVCGKEYYSSADRCFACAETVESPVAERRMRTGKSAVLLIGVALILMGFVGALSSSNKVDGSPSAWRYDWVALSYISVMIFSLGIATSAFSHFGSRVPLWMVREGREPENRKAGAVTSISLGFVVLALGFILMAKRLGDLSDDAIVACSLLLEISIVFALMGYLRSPSFLFSEDERLEVPRKERLISGFILIFVGGIVIATALVFSGQPVGRYAFFLILASLVLIAGGAMTAYGPAFRPWLSTGFERK